MLSQIETFKGVDLKTKLGIANELIEIKEEQEEQDNFMKSYFETPQDDSLEKRLEAFQKKIKLIKN